MKRLLGLLLLAATLASAYVAYPLVTAWQIREAMRDGDAGYLDRKIEWASVRTTLRASLSTIAFDLPDPALADQSDPSYRKPGLWRRVKAYLGRGALDRFVASYVTPEGLPKLFAYRKLYREQVTGQVEPERTLANLPERVMKFCARIVRAGFTSPTAFEFEMKDRNDPDRHFVGLLELKGYAWKLTELRVRSASQMARLAAVMR